jgi:hypothetical protein
MPTLSASQIAAYAAQQWSGNDRDIAVAVALAESGGRTDVVNFLGCVGLWQVYQSVHAHAHPLWTTAWLKQPANNALAAHTIWAEAGGHWTPWSTYTSGAYRSHLGTAQKAVQGVSGVAAAIPGGPVASPLIPLPGVGGLVAGVQLSAQAAQLLAAMQTPEFWRRLAYILIGVVMCIMAIIAMSATPGNVKLVKTAAKVAALA